MSEHVILVDEEDNPLGTAEKMAAHLEGRLHRAFSVFVFDSRGRLLLQRRAVTKYHSPGLWSNTCCSHPRPGESVHEAACRRLGEEMGLACELEAVGGFVYRAELAGGLVEYEYDHVLIGCSDRAPRADASEVAEWRWAATDSVQHAVEEHPEAFTAWFPLAFAHLRRFQAGGRT